MPAAELRLGPSAARLAEGFDRIRDELGIPERFPPAALAEAAWAAGRGPAPAGARADGRELDLVTIDPPGARDLDQALLIARRGEGYRVRYAIADVAAFVTPGRALDAVAHERGVTVYLPDRRTPLHPEAIGEGAASLLPGADRPALLWTIDLDEAGEPVAAGLERATVRSRRALSYAEAQAALAAGTAGEALVLLREVGRLRERLEAERGGVSLTVPVQEVAREEGRYALRYEAPLPVEGWNAQISLLAGMSAARIMAEGGMGLFRAMPPAEPTAMEALRRSAGALGVPWPAGTGYAEVIRGLDPRDPGHAAFALRAARALGGAGYVAWTAGSGEEPPAHAALAARYAHVTAPLRRLADRVANEVVLALSAGGGPPGWAEEALPRMPAIMRAATARERAAERAAIDYLESVVLASRLGEEMEATVIEVRDGEPVAQIAEPAVVARVEGSSAEPGEVVRVRVARADPDERRVVLRAA